MGERTPGETAPRSASLYSKDYWDNVFEQIGRRPLVKAALTVLALLYASAIYAPLIANDRPFVLDAIDTKAYATDQRTLYPAALTIGRYAKQDEASFQASRPASAPPLSWKDALALELAGIERRLGTMRGVLDEELHGPLDAFGEKTAATVAAALAGDAEEAERLAGELKEQAQALRTDYVPRDAGAPEKGGVELVPQRSYPALEATTWGEVFFMWLWALVLAWPLWNRLVNRVVLRRDRERIRRWRKGKWIAVLGSSAIVAALWAVLVGGEMTFDSSPFKERLTAGEIVASDVVFAPVAMGFAENSLEERFRPPTWHGDAEISLEGYYVRGPRKPEADAVTGHRQPPKQVRVEYAEPELNSPWRHVLGTDSMGRNLLVRLLYGGRISLAIGILSTVLLVIIGVAIGSFAGYFGGRTDMVVSRIIEIFQSFPAFFLILTAVALIPADKIHPIFAIVFFIAIVRWTGVARLVRGEFLRLKEQDFVMASRALGCSAPRVIFRHVLPNALGPVLVAGAFSVAAGILTESAISFLGLGIKLPIPSWGSVLNEARGSAEYWWVQIFPGFLIFLTVFCYNVVGEGVRDALDPKRKV